LQTKRLAFVRGVLLLGIAVWRIGIRMMESPKTLPSFTANRLHHHRGMTDRFPYDGIAKGASVACHETATSIVPTPQPHPPTRMSDYAFG
jgi:hypothetical protein